MIYLFIFFFISLFYQIEITISLKCCSLARTHKRGQNMVRQIELSSNFSSFSPLLLIYGLSFITVYLSRGETILNYPAEFSSIPLELCPKNRTLLTDYSLQKLAYSFRNSTSGHLSKATKTYWRGGGRGQMRWSREVRNLTELLFQHPWQQT